MTAYLMQSRPFGHFYLRTKDGERRTFKNLNTSDPVVAHEALTKARAELSGRPWANGRHRWNPEEWQKFTYLRGQTRVSMQSYAMAARAIQALSPHQARFAWVLKPTPKTVVLTELGRVEPNALRLLVAEEICEKRMHSKPATVFCRNVRGVRRASKAD